MKKNKSFIITKILIVFSTITFIPLFSFIYNKPFGEIIRNGVFAVVFAMGFLYFYQYSYLTEKLDYDNKEHPYRLLFAYLVSFLFSLLFPLIDKRAWFFLCMAVAIALFSNAILAFYLVSGLILTSVILAGSDEVTVFVYFFTSFIGVLLFQDIDKSFKVSSSIFISELSLIVLEIAGFLLIQNEQLSAEEFVMPIVNVAINAIALFFSLKYFNVYIANRYRNKFLELNDQEYKALIELKEISVDEYFRSIHTAYLTERMAHAIGCDVDVAKNLAYYHRIKKVFNYSEEDCVNFVNENEFPPKAKDSLLTFLDKNSPLVSKESCIVYISDKFISLLMNIFKQDKKALVDYEEVINALFEKNFLVTTLAESDLTQKDYRAIKNILLKETLYYDFLR